MKLNIANWWHYHKWYVICGIILFGILINLAGNKFHLWQKEADYQIAYIGTVPLPDDTAAAIEKAFASLSMDMNKDGSVIVQLNQYPTYDKLEDPDAASYRTISEVSLIGDISDCDSFFFLLEDPETFQRTYHVLAAADGSCPDDSDYSAANKILSWNDTSLAAAVEDTTADSDNTEQEQILLQNLNIGIRCFYSEKTARHTDQCLQLWNSLKADIIQ